MAFMFGDSVGSRGRFLCRCRAVVILILSLACDFEDRIFHELVDAIDRFQVFELNIREHESHACVDDLGYRQRSLPTRLLYREALSQALQSFDIIAAQQQLLLAIQARWARHDPIFMSMSSSGVLPTAIGETVEFVMDSSIAAYLERFEKGRLAKPTCCLICGLRGALRWHGKYKRSIVTLDRTSVIPIKRLFCGLCRRTFALLPSFVAKFHRYAWPVIRTAMQRLRSQTYDAVADWLMQSADLNVATLTLYFWRRKFA